MLISKEVEVKLYGKKIKHYESLGYVLPKRKTKDGMCVPRGATLKVKIEDVPLGSHIDVQVKCDYCGKHYLTRYDGYIKRKQNDIPLDCCNDCKPRKNKELNMLRYGVENQFQRENIKIKIKEVMLEKYGANHPMKVQTIKEKAMKRMSDNNGIECSKQQIYLCQLFKGELNYIDDSTKGYVIDIALKDKKIAIEYNGGGHDLQVKLGNVSLEEFNNKEIIRYQTLKRNGWKQIKIYSPCDYLPSDDILLAELDKALEWLSIDKKHHNHYNIKIGKFAKDEIYGHLRFIKIEDLRNVI